MAKWVIPFSFSIPGGFGVRSFLLGEISAGSATRGVGQVRIVGESSQPILDFSRDLQMLGKLALTLQFSRSNPVTIVIISILFDVFEPVAHFIVAISLGHSTARPGIK